MFRKRIPSNIPVFYPKSPPRQHKGIGNTKAVGFAAPLQGGLENPTTTFTITYRATSTSPKSNKGRRSGLSAFLKACHSPVRGHEPGIKSLVPVSHQL